MGKHASLPPQGGGTGVEPDPRGHRGWGSTHPVSAAMWVRFLGGGVLGTATVC